MANDQLEQNSQTSCSEDEQESYTPSTEEDLRQALQQKDEQLLRTIADFENFRKRTVRDAKEQEKAGKRQLLMGLLEVMDSFERGLQSKAMQKETAVTQGVRVVCKQLKQLLERHQVLSFDSVGQKFDPILHEALHTLEDHEHPDGYIIEEFRKGYVWEWNILRPALVTVIKNDPQNL